MDVVLQDQDDLDWLRRQVKSERDVRRRDRLRIVLLALRGFTAPQIANMVGCSRRNVQRWVYRYRDEGIDGLSEKPRSGQPKKLIPSLEEQFRKRIEAGPTDDDHVCTLRGRDIQRILEKEFGAKYSLQGVYDLLHRLGYSCLKPRPLHRKNDPQAMAAWLADAPFLSAKSGENTSRRKSRSGSRTKRASANREH